MGSQGTIRLRPVGPYNFHLSFQFYHRSRFETVDRFADRYFIRPLMLAETPVLIKIPCTTRGLVDSLTISWHSPAEVGDTRPLRRLLTRMLYLDFDLEEFYRQPLDPLMRKLIRKYRGFRPILTPDVFEAAAWAIIGQQVNLQFAYRLKSRLVAAVDRTFQIDGERYYLFPRADEIAMMTIKSLRAMQLSQRKAEYLLDFSRMVAEGKLDLEALARDEYEAACEKLMSIRGLGPWSANYILMRGAGHQDAFPFGDSGINHAVCSLYGVKGNPGVKHITKLSDRWRPYRALACFYLWKSL
jgi:DNA-3-methyladenine glycosylase II